MASPNMVDVYIVWATITFSTERGGQYEILIDGHLFTTIASNTSLNSATVLLSFPGTHRVEVQAFDFATGLVSLAASATLTINAKGEGATISPIVQNSPLSPAATFSLVSPPYYAVVITELFLSAAYQFLVSQQSSKGASPASSNYVGGQYQNFVLPNTNPASFSDSYPIGSAVHVEARPQNSLGQTLANVAIQVVDFIAGAPQPPTPINPIEIPLANITLIQILAGDPNNQITIDFSGIPSGNATILFLDGDVSLDLSADDVTAGQIVLTPGTPAYDYINGIGSTESETVTVPVNYQIVDSTGKVIIQSGTYNPD